VQDHPENRPEGHADHAKGAHVGRDLAAYTLARIGLVAVLAVILVLVKIPLLVSLAIAVVVALPLSMVLFRNLNQRVTSGLAAKGAGRRAQRDRLRAQLRGDEVDS
jgi:Flp pilus assembly protein TadB